MRVPDAPEYRESYAALAEAFTIFARYQGPEDHFHIVALPKQVLTGPFPARVTVEDTQRLAELGWEADEQWECFRYSAPG